MVFTTLRDALGSLNNTRLVAQRSGFRLKLDTQGCSQYVLQTVGETSIFETFSNRGEVAEIAADLSGEKAAAVAGDYLEVVLPTNVTYCVAPIGVAPPQARPTDGSNNGSSSLN